MVSPQQFAVGYKVGRPVGEDTDLVVLIIGHVRIECGCVCCFMGNNLADQFYGGIVPIVVSGPALDNYLLQIGIGYGEQDGQWPHRCI